MRGGARAAKVSLAAAALFSMSAGLVAAGPSEDAQFDELVRSAYEADLANDPNRRTRRAITRSEAEWTPATDERRAQEARIAAARLETLARQIDREALSPDHRVKYDIYASGLESEIVEHKTTLNGYTVYSNIFDPLREYPQILTRFQKIETVEDAQNYIARLNGLPHVVSDVLDAGEERLERAVVMMKSGYRSLARLAEEHASGAPCGDGPALHTLAKDFRTKLADSDVPAERRPALIADADRALQDAVCPAYAAAAARLQGMVESGRDQGMWAMANGAEHYRDFVEFSLGERVDPMRIHERGLEEVAKIKAELAEMAKQAGLSGDTQELNRHLKTDKGLSLPNTDEGYAEFEARAKSYLAEIRKKLPDYFNHIPVQELSVERALTGPLGAGPPSSGSFYTPAPADGARPAIYNLAFPPGPDRIETWTLKSTTFHEGLPGHHLQFATARELQGEENEALRSGSVAAYTEGWALYAEQLANEMGLYTDDPYGKIGWMQMRMERAIRLVLDTGLNALEWTPEEAIAFQRAHLANEAGIGRFLSWPGQALGYYWGYLEILALREKAKAELGDAFDIKDFHDVILRHGPMPPPVMRAAVDAWIASVKSQN